MNSFRFFAGTDGCAVITLVAAAISATGTRSFWSHGSLANIAGLPTWYAEYDTSSV